MECCQHKAQLGGVGKESWGIPSVVHHRHVIAYPSAHHVDKRAEDEQNPDDAKHVEEHVRQGRPSCLGIGRHCRQVRRHGGTDILTHHQGNTLIDRQCATRTEYHRDGHHRCRRLYAERQDTTQHQKYQGRQERIGVERGKEVQHGLILTQMHVLSRLAQDGQCEHQESNAKQEVADIAVLLLVDEDNTNEEGRIRQTTDVERHTCRHNPCRQRRTDVGTHNDRDGLSQRQQSSIHKRDGHHRRSGRGLYRSRHQRTSQHTGKTVGGHSSQDVSQLWTRHFLECLTHGLHAEHQQSQRAQKREKYPN